MQPPPVEMLGDVLRAVVPDQAPAMSEARARQALATPAGALGTVDHGVDAPGVSPRSQRVTAATANKEHRDG